MQSLQVDAVIPILLTAVVLVGTNVDHVVLL